MNEISILGLLHFPKEISLSFLMKESFVSTFRKTSSSRKFRVSYSLDLWTRIKLSGVKNERKSSFEKESSRNDLQHFVTLIQTISAVPAHWKRSSHTEELIEESRAKFFRISLNHQRTSRRGNKRKGAVI